MSRHAPASERLLRRLAEGVRRTRLIEPILAARPPFVVVSAPSGYGKTVLVAQLAVSGAYESVYWVDGLGSSSSLSRALAELLGQLADRDIDCVGWSSDDVFHSFVCEVTGLPSDVPALIVLDSMDGDTVQSDVARIAEAALQMPVGSTVIMVTKALLPRPQLPKETWLLDPEMLRLDERETADMWDLHHGSPTHRGGAGELAEMSGCHAALASLMARRSALLGGSSTPGACDSLSAELIRSLVSSQLEESQLLVLSAAAVAGEGTSGLLRACTGNDEVDSTLTRIAEVLPLVICADSGTDRTFAVSSLVATALGGAKALAEQDPSVVGRLVRELARTGRDEEALSIATKTQVPSLAAEVLRDVGGRLLACQNADLVGAALACVPAAIVSGDCHLLTLVAECEWHARRPSEALRSARLALCLAENVDDRRAVLKARLAIARFRWSMGDLEGIVGELAPLVSRWNTVDDVDDLCSLVASSEVAYSLAGDRNGLAMCRAIAGELRECAGALDSALARLDEIDGLVAALLDGDYLLSLQMFGKAAACRRLSAPRRVSALNNLASSALMAGLLDEAAASAESAAALVRPPCADLACVAALESIQALVSGLRGSRLSVKPPLDKAVDAESADGDRFGLTSALVFASLGVLVFGERAIALGYSERAARAAADTGSPVLVSLAELVHAMCCLAVDDSERARATAERVLPEVEAIGAMGHVLHARMILAEVAMRDEDLSEAVRHLSEISDHIIETSPAFVVACYLRTFPELLGPLALAMGVDAIPSRVLNLLNGEYERDALAAAAAVLTKPELRRLQTRTRQEADRAAARDRTTRDETAVCEVRLLGGFEVKAPHGIVADRDWVKRKARLLFAILVAKGGTDIARGEIIDHLWPDMDEERGLSNFYVVWSAMKRALSPGGSRDQASPFVEHNRGVCRVVPGRVVSDLDTFKAALGQARTAHAAGDPRGELTALLEALRLYRGDVLPGDIYDDWFGPIRERFKHDYEDTALRVGRLYAGAGELLEALSVLRDASGRNPWREDIYQAILRLQIASGQRAAAIETYFMCRSRLVEDLGIDPSRETTALYEEVLGMDEHAS